MNTVRLEFHKMDVERIMITLGIAIMEGFGLLTFLCGLLGIKIF